MNSTLATALPGSVDPRDLRRSLVRADRQRKLRAIALTLPLLLFLALTFLVPICVLLKRAVENPEVANALPRTVAALQGWNREGAPPAEAYAALTRDLGSLSDSADAGALARRLNSETPGARSLVMSTYRALPLPQLTAASTAAEIRSALLAVDARWSEAPYWQAIAKNGSRWTPDYLLTSVDLRRDAKGAVARVEPEQRAFGRILVRTFEISLVVTLWCLVLAYPLAYWLTTLSRRRANVLMILVLVPFWTSILVRVAAWIVLLQSEGLVNHALIGLHLIDQPLALLFNRTGVDHRDGAHPAAVHDPAALQRDDQRAVDLPARGRVARQPAAGRVLPHLRAADLPRHRRRGAAGVHPGIGYYVTPALLGGARRPDAELLHRPVHQRQRQLGHGVRARRLAAGGDAGAVRDLPARHERRAEPGLRSVDDRTDPLAAELSRLLRRRSTSSAGGRCAWPASACSASCCCRSW